MIYLLWLLPLLFVGLLWAGWRTNRADWGGPWLNTLAGLNRLLCCRYHRLVGELSTLPTEGAAVVVANHHSGLDPFLLIAASPRPLRFLIAQEEYNRRGLTWLFRAVGCIPVDRGGRPERAFREALKVLARGEVVALFPHGGIRLDDEPRCHLKPGAVRLARLASCPVVPVRLDGIAGVGEVMASIYLRGRPRLTPYTPLICDEPQQCLQQIQQLIETPAPECPNSIGGGR